MQKIPISLARDGMVLARDIVQNGTPSGPPICGKGTVLTDRLLERLNRLEITSVCVDGHPVDLPGEPTVESLITALENRFMRVGGDRRMVRIKELFRKKIEQSGRQAG